MDFLNGLSDDQTALLGCAAALLVSGTMMSLSYYVGRLQKRAQSSPEPTEPHTLRMPDPLAARTKELERDKRPAIATINPVRRAA